MCIICNNTRNMQSLTLLYCNGCTSLTTIPDTLVNLTQLDCTGCTSLTTIPDTLVNLTRLNCIGKIEPQVSSQNTMGARQGGKVIRCYRKG